MMMSKVCKSWQKFAKVGKRWQKLAKVVPFLEYIVLWEDLILIVGKYELWETFILIVGGFNPFLWERINCGRLILFVGGFKYNIGLPGSNNEQNCDTLLLI